MMEDTVKQTLVNALKGFQFSFEQVRTLQGYPAAIKKFCQAKRVARQALKLADCPAHRYYAVARWHVDDVRQQILDLHRDGFDKVPNMTKEQAAEWLEKNGSKISDEMVRVGWEVLESLLLDEQRRD